MNTVTFNPDFEIMFDYRGVSSLASGTSPHNPNETRLILRNCDFDSVSDEVDAKVAELADDDNEDELREYIYSAFKFVGRARESSLV
jgi:hypothetical protein